MKLGKVLKRRNLLTVQSGLRPDSGTRKRTERLRSISYAWLLEARDQVYRQAKASNLRSSENLRRQGRPTPSLTARLTAFLIVPALLVACSTPTSTNEPDPKTNAPAAIATETSPVIEATPTSENAPSSFTENLATLKKMGYSLRQGEGGWELVDPNGTVAFSSIDSLTVTALGANGELIVVPEQSFGVTETVGLGMERLLTLKDLAGNITHTYLEKAGYTVPLAEIQREPREIENYPQVPIEDLWNGRLAQSEALTALPFPEGTVPPDGFGYMLWKGADTYWVFLSDVVDGVVDGTSSSHYTTYHRRWANFYRSQTPEGVDVVVGTEQILMPDGQTSMFLHYVFGPEWPWEESIKYGTGSLYNLIDSVFLSYTKPPEPGYESVQMRPVVFTDSYDPNNTTWRMLGIVRGQVAATHELYQLPQNNPASMLPGLEELARAREPSIRQAGFLDWADMSAVEKLQNVGLKATWPLTLFKANRNQFFAERN